MTHKETVPKPGDLWEIDEMWRGKKFYALVLQVLINRHDDDVHHNNHIEPLYRCLIEGDLVDLHWSWFKCRLAEGLEI